MWRRRAPTRTSTLEVFPVARPNERDGAGAPATGEGRTVGAALDCTEGGRGRRTGRGAACQPYSPDPLPSQSISCPKSVSIHIEWSDQIASVAQVIASFMADFFIF